MLKYHCIAGLAEHETEEAYTNLISQYFDQALLKLDSNKIEEWFSGKYKKELGHLRPICNLYHKAEKASKLRW